MFSDVATLVRTRMICSSPKVANELDRWQTSFLSVLASINQICAVLSSSVVVGIHAIADGNDESFVLDVEHVLAISGFWNPECVYES